MEGGESVPNQFPDHRTIPQNLQFSAQGFPDESSAHAMVYKIHLVLSVLSEYIDLSSLDGVTIAYDYDTALTELDRGYDTSYKLTATKDVAIGVAMAPTVIRQGVKKTHLVVNAGLMLGILDEPGFETDDFRKSLHLIAHECAHVEVTAAFDRAFPGFLLEKLHSNALDNIRWQVILATWDEYAACRIVGSVGSDPTGGYLEILLKVLGNTRAQCFELIRKYRLDGDVDRVSAAVYGKLGDLLKFASYFLGVVATTDLSQTHPIELSKEDEFEWFEPFYRHLIEAHSKLWEEFGKWKDQKCFEKLGDILEEMAESIGVKAVRLSTTKVYFDIPYRRESMPLG